MIAMSTVMARRMLQIGPLLKETSGRTGTFSQYKGTDS